MPHIVVYCPKLTFEQKANCVKYLTGAFAEATGLDSELLTIHILEHSYENIGVGGRLLASLIAAEKLQTE